MTRLAAILLALSLGSLPGETTPLQDAQPPTFKAGVELVSVSVVVKTQKGRPVTGLSRKDFELFDAGLMRDIADFRADASPVSVAVLLDTSGSMHLSGKWAAARDAVARIAAELERGRDHIALFAFDNELHVVQPFTASPADVVSALDSVQPWGSTAMFDAVAETGKRLAEDGGMRRAIVVITDGLDNRSRLDAAAVSAVASAIDVPVYSFVVSSPLDHLNDGVTAGDGAALKPHRGTLDDLSRWTGGASFESGTPVERAAAVGQIVRELRQQYVMTFESGMPAGWHPLLVRVHEGSNFVVRTRSGYMAGPQSSGRF
jgi:Ca-activated chloride channel family protein